MKNLSSYLEEGKKETKKPHSTHKSEGADDKKYIALIVEYKKLRRSSKNREEPAKTLKKALKLGKEGDVSDKAKVGSAYL